MINAFITIKNNLLKIITIFVISFPVLFFINTGFRVDDFIKIIQSALFSLIVIIVIILPEKRKYIFILVLFLFICMFALYIFEIIQWADVLGSTGLGFILLNIISYIPQLIKLGYIKKI